MHECLHDGREWCTAVCRRYDGQERHNRKSKNKIKSMNLTYDEQSTKKYKRKEWQITGYPPGCRLTEHESSEGDAERRWVKDMFLADSEDIFRCHRPSRSKDKETNAGIISRSNRTNNKGENKSGDVHRFNVWYGTETF